LHPSSLVYLVEGVDDVVDDGAVLAVVDELEHAGILVEEDGGVPADIRKSMKI
jgi:hypothetical protein